METVFVCSVTVKFIIFLKDKHRCKSRRLFPLKFVRRYQRDECSKVLGNSSNSHWIESEVDHCISGHCQNLFLSWALYRDNHVVLFQLLIGTKKSRFVRFDALQEAA